MLLAIDIGNSQTKLGLFRGEKLITTVRFLTPVRPLTNEFVNHLHELCRKARIQYREIADAVVSSVVPKQSVFIKKVLQKHFSIKPLIVSGKLNVGIKIRYKNPGKLGADRLCNAVAAFHTFGGPCIVVDFGTATKYEVISKRGEYLGGAIAIGIETAAAALHSRTAQLPNIKLQLPKKVAGTSTVECIQSGVFFGAIDGMEGMISRFKKITGKNAPVIVTGGFSELLSRHTTSVGRIEPHLVLEGARIIYERVHSDKQ